MDVIQQIGQPQSVPKTENRIDLVLRQSNDKTFEEVFSAGEESSSKNTREPLQEDPHLSSDFGGTNSEEEPFDELGKIAKSENYRGNIDVSSEKTKPLDYENSYNLKGEIPENFLVNLGEFSGNNSTKGEKYINEVDIEYLNDEAVDQERKATVISAGENRPEIKFMVQSDESTEGQSRRERNLASPNEIEHYDLGAGPRTAQIDDSDIANMAGQKHGLQFEKIVSSNLDQAVAQRENADIENRKHDIVDQNLVEKLSETFGHSNLGLQFSAASNESGLESGANGPTYSSLAGHSQFREKTEVFFRNAEFADTQKTALSNRQNGEQSLSGGASTDVKANISFLEKEGLKVSQSIEVDATASQIVERRNPENDQSVPIDNKPVTTSRVRENLVGPSQIGSVQVSNLGETHRKGDLDSLKAAFGTANETVPAGSIRDRLSVAKEAPSEKIPFPISSNGLLERKSDNSWSSKSPELKPAIDDRALIHIASVGDTFKLGSATEVSVNSLPTELIPKHLLGEDSEITHEATSRSKTQPVLDETGKAFGSIANNASLASPSIDTGSSAGGIVAWSTHDSPGLLATVQADAEDSLIVQRASEEVPFRAEAKTQANVPDKLLNIQGFAAAIQTENLNQVGLSVDGQIRGQREALELSIGGVLEIRGALEPTHPTSPPVSAEPRLAQAVAQQLSAFAKPIPDGSIEISLRPEELGRVRMLVSSVDGMIHVVVNAERAETIDLMRRNIEMLQHEFRELGYKQASFEFGQQGQQNERYQSHPEEELGQVAETDSNGNKNLTLLAKTADGGIDIRL